MRFDDAVWVPGTSLSGRAGGVDFAARPRLPLKHRAGEVALALAGVAVTAGPQSCSLDRSF